MDNFSLTDHRSFSTIERQMIWQSLQVIEQVLWN